MSTAQSVSRRIRIERHIVRTLVKEAIANGYTVTVSWERGYDVGQEGGPEEVNSNNVGKIMAEAFACDECHLFLHNAEGQQQPVIDGRINSAGWVYLVFGNDGWDVITDYTVNLEAVIGEGSKVGALTDKYMRA